MKKIIILVLIFVILALAACSPARTGSNSSADATLAPVPAEYAGRTNPLGADAAATGAEVYKVNCSACHGEQGHGDGPAGAALNPAPKNLAQLQTMAADDYLFWRISTGKDGTSMIGWKDVLSEEQIWQVITFLHTLK
jgi:high-affinity iron transporter